MYQGEMADLIPLRWIKNDIEGARFAFGEVAHTYLGAPIQADFKLSLESLAPYVTEVLDLSAPLEGAGVRVALVEIKGGKVRVF